MEAEQRSREDWLKQREGKPIIECKEVENYFWELAAVISLYKYGIIT